MNKSETSIVSYSLSPINVSRLTQMNKNLLDVAYDTLDPKLFAKPYAQIPSLLQPARTP